MTNTNPMATALRYAEAKGRQDIDAALACCTGDFILEAPAAGTRAHGEEEVRQQLAGLFDALPDYRFITEGSALGENGEVVLWGRFRGTSRARLGRRKLRRRPVEVPASANFLTRDGLLCRETFYFDGLTLAAQAGGLPASWLGRLRRLAAPQLHEAASGPLSGAVR